jgi:hypothetical protein
MTNITTKPDSSQPAAEMAVDLFDNWFDPIETEVRRSGHIPCCRLSIYTNQPCTPWFPVVPHREPKSRV